MKSEKASYGMEIMLLLPNLNVTKFEHPFRLVMASRLQDLSERFVNISGLESVTFPTFMSD